MDSSRRNILAKGAFLGATTALGGVAGIALAGQGTDIVSSAKEIVGKERVTDEAQKTYMKRGGVVGAAIGAVTSYVLS